MKLTHKDVWSFSYRGVTGEIQKRDGMAFLGHEFSWTYYLYLCLPRFVDQEFAETLWLEDKKDEKGRVHHDYYANEFLSGLNLHGGITFYDKISHEPKVIKIGCDFQHYWDEGKHYSETGIGYEARSVIDDIYARHPLNIWCQGDGRVVPENEGDWNEDKSVFISHVYQAIKAAKSTA